MNARRGYQEELVEISDLINRMGKQTTSFVIGAVEALVAFDSIRAEDIRHHEREIDALHQQIEEKCITIIATQQPVAGDLRFLIGSIKVSTEMERIADYANNIAKITHRKLSKLDVKPIIHLGSVIENMGRLAVDMLAETLRAYVSRDQKFIAIAKDRDKEVNKSNRNLFNLLIDTGNKSGSVCQAMLEMYTAIRYLERVADRTVNIAGWVYYMETGFRYVG